MAATADVTDSFDQLLDVDMWIDVVVILAAFLAPTVLANVLEGELDVDLPNEVYGVVVFILGSFAPYSAEVRIGSALYIADKGLERVGLKQTVTQMGV